MAQWLRTWTALPEDPGSIPRTHTAANNCLELQPQKIQHPSPTAVSTIHTCDVQAYMQAKHTYT